MAESLPARIGRYEIRGRIADGATGGVFAGRLVGPGGFARLHAVKVLDRALAADRELVRELLHDEQAARALAHANVVRVHDAGDDDGRVFVATELVLGESLRGVWLAARARLDGARAEGEVARGATALPRDVVCWIGARLAEALHEAHELSGSGKAARPLLHLDVSPSRVLVSYEGEPKLAGFGFGRALSRVSAGGFAVLKGDVSHMAPEHARGATDLDRRADVFSLAVTLWELTTDAALFDKGEPAATLAAIAAGAVPEPETIVPDYPRELWRVLRRALDPDRNERHATALELSRELDALARGGGRRITSAAVGELMQELFGAEWARAARWLEAAGGDAPVAEALRGPEQAARAPVELVGAVPGERAARGARHGEGRATGGGGGGAPTTASPPRGRFGAAPLPAPVLEAPSATPRWQWIAVGCVVLAAVVTTCLASRV